MTSDEISLDGEERKLTEGMLLIADGDGASAIAGVMGGLDSEVTDNTINVLLECALFEPSQVRKTRTALGLSTDASYRFERGVDPDMMMRAVQRAVSVILETAGGTVTGLTDVHPNPMQRVSVDVRAQRVEKLLGRKFSVAEMAGLLAPIGLAGKADGNTLRVDVPGHRLYDVVKEHDVIEEVGVAVPAEHRTGGCAVTAGKRVARVSRWTWIHRSENGGFRWRGRG